MNIEELVTKLRSRLDDTGGDTIVDWMTDDSYCLFSNERLTGYLDSAQQEYTHRRAIKDSRSRVTRIATREDRREYNLDPRIITVEEVQRESTGDRIPKMHEDPGARHIVDLCPYDCYVVDIDEHRLEIWDTPTSDDRLLLSVTRHALNRLVWTQNDESPEIPVADHEALLDWACYLAFMVPDTDTYDPDIAGRFQGAFTRKVGPRKSAKIEQIHNTVSDRPLRVRPCPI